MRLLLILLLPLLTNGEMWQTNKANYRGFQMREQDEFANGQVITFYFKDHYQYPTDRIEIPFFDEPLRDYSKDDLKAIIIFDRKDGVVTTNSRINGDWGWENRRHFGGLVPRDTWWRIDVIKVSSHVLAVFFNGYWALTYKFAKSLDNVHTFYVMARSIEFDTLSIMVNPPDHELLVEPSWENVGALMADQNCRAYSDRVKVLPHFLDGEWMAFTVFFIKSAYQHDGREPGLHFFIGGYEALKIYQQRQNEVWQFLIRAGDEEMMCPTVGGAGGDLQHFRLSRIRNDELLIHLFYQYGGTADCIVKVRGIQMLEHKPIEIHARRGALVYHIQYNRGSNYVPSIVR